MGNSIVDIELTDEQTGYDAIAEYVKRYWDHNVEDDVVVSIGTSYDGVEYDLSKEIASPFWDGVEFVNDWWEGQKYIKLFGIKAIGEFDISGGIYFK